MYYILYTIAYHTMNQKSSVMHSVMEYNLIFFVFLVDIMKRFLGKANLPVYPNAGKRGMKLYTDGEIASLQKISESKSRRNLQQQSFSTVDTDGH